MIKSELILRLQKKYNSLSVNDIEKIIDLFTNYSINKSMKINLGLNNITNYTDNQYGPFTKKTLFLKLKNEF